MRVLTPLLLTLPPAACAAVGPLLLGRAATAAALLLLLPPAAAAPASGVSCKVRALEFRGMRLCDMSSSSGRALLLWHRAGKQAERRHAPFSVSSSKWGLAGYVLLCIYSQCVAKDRLCSK
jgi:hypothetical protein